MERTPKSRKFSFSRKFKSNEYGDASVEEIANRSVHKTPIQQKSPLSQETDYSPVYLPQTQEAFDQLDVIWDWNSPQSKYRKKLPVQKQTDGSQSTKPIKRHTSNNQIESCNKLKCELEAFKNELQSGGTEKHSSRVLFSDDKIKDELKDLGVLFDDNALEEEMILQSQKVENLLATQVVNNFCDIFSVQTTIINNNKYCETSKTELRKVKSENQIDTSSKQLNKKTSSNSEISSTEKQNLVENSSINYDSFDNFSSENQIKHPTESNMESKYKKQVNANNICNADEIEQKKLLAIAKLKSKKSAASTMLNYYKKSDTIAHHLHQNQHYETSPIKCTPKEIEQKRLQALAKLEAKKKQEKIERNRREALKRLEMNKKKRAINLSLNKK